MTISNILRRNLISILTPMLLSVLGLGMLAVVIIFRFINSDLYHTNSKLLLQIMDQFKINFSFNPIIISRAKAIVSALDWSYAEHQSSLFINSIINTPVFTYPYIHSAYVYYYGYDMLFCSNIGLVRVSDFYDRDWVEALDEPPLPEDSTWFKYREVQPHPFERGHKVFTLSHALFSSGVPRSDGIITLNFGAGYVFDMLQSQITYDGQMLLAVDFRRGVVLSNDETLPSRISFEELARIKNKSSGDWSSITGRRYLIYKTEPSNHGLVFISLVPLMSGYRLAAELIIMTLIVVIIVTVVGVAVAMTATQRHRRQLAEIIRIFTDFENSGAFPAIDSKNAEASNVYEYIINNILGIFLRNHQMKLQLQERKYQQGRYELKALQAQINPHFLYNVLETINWKTIELVGGYNTVNEMIENLSRILKYCLSQAEEKVTIRDEIEYTKRYIALQNIRYDHNIQVLWKYREEDLDIRVMKLVFQPIIENAMKHGGLSHTREVEIVIQIIRKKNHLCISIADNGVGMDLGRLMEVRTSLSYKWQDDTHIGLINTNQRLRLLYGETCSIKIFSKKNAGTTVWVLLPIDHITLLENKNNEKFVVLD